MSAIAAVPRYINELTDEGGLKGADIANIAQVSRATVSRWKSGDAKPQPNNELILADLFYVVGRLRDYYSTENIRTWLYAPHPQLGGQKAIDLIHAGKTIEVLRVLDRLENDVFI